MTVHPTRPVDGERMDRFRLALTEAEELLVARIEFGEDHLDHDARHEAFLANQEPILELLRSLGARGAVPSHRLSYWNDPAFFPGRTKGSRREMFERNGTVGNMVYIHPGFVRHLRYILFGADLPVPIMLAFEREAGDPEWVSYGDALELGKKARVLVRRHRLATNDAAEQFFKLSLDLGLSVDEALRIRKSVADMR